MQETPPTPPANETLSFGLVLLNGSTQARILGQCRVNQSTGFLQFQLSGAPAGSDLPDGLSEPELVMLGSQCFGMAVRDHVKRGVPGWQPPQQAAPKPTLYSVDGFVLKSNGGHKPIFGAGGL